MGGWLGGLSDGLELSKQQGGMPGDNGGRGANGSS